jgi:signal transduction histidine kinase
MLYLRDVTHEAEVDRMKSEFLATAAHELRTPMTGLHAGIELLLTRDFEAPRRLQMLKMMQRQSVVLRDVVDELLDLARIEARRDADFDYQVLPLDDIVEQTLQDFIAPAVRPEPERQGGLSTARVRVDRQKVAQVLRNLLSNAYKYSPAPQPVTVRLLPAQDRPEGRRVGVEVEDRGIGMDAAQLARVGERFYRADAAGHVPGTGLGITIVQEILGLMGGSLTITSQPGVGTTATVWLPVAAADATA